MGFISFFVFCLPVEPMLRNLAVRVSKVSCSLGPKSLASVNYNISIRCFSNPIDKNNSDGL